jgi:hypothetical protein
VTNQRAPDLIQFGAVCAGIRPLKGEQGPNGAFFALARYTGQAIFAIGGRGEAKPRSMKICYSHANSWGSFE